MGIGVAYQVRKLGMYDIVLSHADIDVISHMEKKFPDIYPLLGPKGKRRSDVCSASLLIEKANNVLKLFNQARK